MLCVCGREGGGISGEGGGGGGGLCDLQATIIIYVINSIYSYLSKCTIICDNILFFLLYQVGNSHYLIKEIHIKRYRPTFMIIIAKLTIWSAVQVYISQ